MKLKERFINLVAFVKRSLNDLPGTQEDETSSFFARVVRVVNLLFRGYMDDDLTIHAASLTFVTLTSLVPVLAVAFALTRGFGAGTDSIESFIHLDWLEDMPVQFQQFVGQLLELVEKTNFSALGGIGLAFLVLTAVLMLANIEKSFNRVWGVSKNRSMPKQIMSYTSVLVLVPLLMGAAGALRAQIVINQRILGMDPNVWIQNIVSFLTMWSAFCLLYVFVPNTRVHIRPALAGSLVTTLVFAGWMKMFMIMQVGVSRNNAIYGAFAAIPVFMFWLYATWVILLLGAEFTFALQNADTYSLETKADNSSMRARLLVALMIVRQAGLAMEGRGRMFDAALFSRRYKVPIRLVNVVVQLLCGVGYLVKVADQADSYVLTRSPESTGMDQFIRDLMKSGGGFEDLQGRIAADSNLRLMLDKLNDGLHAGFDGLTLTRLIEPTPGEKA